MYAGIAGIAVVESSSRERERKAKASTLTPICDMRLSLRTWKRIIAFLILSPLHRSCYFYPIIFAALNLAYKIQW